MKKFTESCRAQIARGWASSGLDQATYAGRHGISARTLRSWIARYASRQAPVNQVRTIVEDTIEKLQAVLDGLDVPGGMPDDSEGETGIEEQDEVELIKESEAQPACPPAPLPSPPPRPTRPRSVSGLEHEKFDWGF